MREAVIVDAVRTPIGRGKQGRGDLSAFHPAHLLGRVQDALVERNGIDPAEIEQVVGGCVTQAGEQSNNITRVAWLSRGKGWRAGGTTVDTQCGSGQQANNIISAFVRSGMIDAGIACGVEVMSHVGLGANVINGPGFFLPPNFAWEQPMSQFEACERIAETRGITREDVDAFAVRSQERARKATDEGRFEREILAIDAPVLGDDMQPTGETRRVAQDQGLRDTTMESLAGLKPVQEGGIHTAGNSSQVSDGAAGLLYMSAERAKELGLRPRARIVHDVVVGCDPHMLLEGPIDATQKMIDRYGLDLKGVDLFECNEAFAAVVLSWLGQFPDIDPEKVNVNGGAIALGHPVGCTGSRLIVSALHELERTDQSTAFITMCCGSAVGTGTLIERL